jgi:hypothetical protein
MLKIIFIGVPILLLIFIAVFGPNKVKGKPWRGWKQPSTQMGPERPDPPDSRRS